jgi:formylglycine-generating enzyme required for sulfatase activity
MKRTTALLLTVLAISASLTSCGGDGNLTEDLGSVLGDFQILDLATGTVESRVVVPDLVTNAAYRSSKMVFRAVDGGSGVSGSEASGFGAQVDEVRGTMNLPRFYIGVFEVTRDQWQLLAGTTPWTTQPSGLIGSAAGGKPASGMSRDELDAALVVWNLGRASTVALPNGSQWEYACRAGTSSTFSWGEDRSDAVVGTYAVVSETAGGVVGPQVVGEQSANAFGLFDMHGNLWEFTTTDDIRGGSWRDSLPMSRSANRKSLDQQTGHPLVGLRLVLSL